VKWKVTVTHLHTLRVCISGEKLRHVQSGLEVTTPLPNVPYGCIYAFHVLCAMYHVTHYAHMVSDSVVTYHLAVSQCPTAHGMHILIHLLSK
jgi:hypothetical protein